MLELEVDFSVRIDGDEVLLLFSSETVEGLDRAGESDRFDERYELNEV